MKTENKRVDYYIYATQDGIDDNCEPCDVLTISLLTQDRKYHEIDGITLDKQLFGRDELTELCEEIIQNYGFVLE